MVEKGLPAGVNSTPWVLRFDELNADLRFEIADLPAERRLRGVQLLLGRPPSGCRHRPRRRK